MNLLVASPYTQALLIVLPGQTLLVSRYLESHAYEECQGTRCKRVAHIQTKHHFNVVVDGFVVEMNLEVSQLNTTISREGLPCPNN